MAKCLYNGIEAPAIPDSLKDHPRLAICGSTHSLAVFYGEPTIVYDTYSAALGEYIAQVESLNGKIDVYKQNADKTGWTFNVSYSMGANKKITLTPFWTNFDIKRTDGSVYRYGTKPVPVYSGISIRCPDSVRQGLFIIVACDSPEQPYVDFTCTMSGNTSSRTKLMQNTAKTLRLQCGSDERASALLLTVESGGATASKAITVIPGSPGTGDNEYDTDSRVTDIAMMAFPDMVAPGGYSIMLISVNGEGNYSQRITAQISGHTSADTQYFSDGYFCNIAVGKDETAESVLVAITSAQDPTVSASATVTIDHSGNTPVDPGTDEERLQRAFWKGFAAGVPG